MRVDLGGDEAVIQQRFSNMLSDVGEGRLARDSNNVITLPEGLGTHVPTLDHLISKVYDDADCMDDPLYIGQRTILCTTNVHVDSINDLMINLWRGISKTYLSVDIIRNSDYELTYSTEFLNSLNISGMPPHKLTFKVGTPVILSIILLIYNDSYLTIVLSFHMNSSLPNIGFFLNYLLYMIYSRIHNNYY